MPAVRKNKQKNKWEFDYKDLRGNRNHRSLNYSSNLNNKRTKKANMKR